MTEILLMLLQWATGTEYIPTAKLEESQRRVRILERNISDLLWELDTTRTTLDALRESVDRLTLERLNDHD